MSISPFKYLRNANPFGPIHCGALPPRLSPTSTLTLFFNRIGLVGSVQFQDMIYKSSFMINWFEHLDSEFCDNTYSLTYFIAILYTSGQLRTYDRHYLIMMNLYINLTFIYLGTGGTFVIVVTYTTSWFTTRRQETHMVDEYSHAHALA
ncbi:hypothetical protein C8R45DRAFT_929271 [Mycena sanguinolenta]|nr:hypothetical protein C8R45DRAFT_929271 [Mycena sanguinolenta]